jgi:Ca2+-binding RTX toxin-like protein
MVTNINFLIDNAQNGFWRLPAQGKLTLDYYINPDFYDSTKAAPIKNELTNSNQYKVSSINIADLPKIVNAQNSISQVANIIFNPSNIENADIAYMEASITTKQFLTTNYGFAFPITFSSDNAYAYNAVFVNKDAFNAQGNAFTNSNIYKSEAYLHELLHALQLSHPNGNGNDSGFNQDSTIMSYNTNGQVGGSEVTTPMIYDIWALQSIYGANTSYNFQNTNYNSTFITGASKAWTIWDAGGVDTIDASALAVAESGVKIDLRGGVDADGKVRFSEIGDERVAIAFDIREYQDSDMTKPLLAGKDGVVDIENATGNKGNDTIYGNNLANILNGEGGNDIIDGGKGNDSLSGGDGADSYIFGKQGEGVDRINDSDGQGRIKIDGKELQGLALKTTTNQWELEGYVLKKVGDDLEISYGSSDKIIIENVGNKSSVFGITLAENNFTSLRFDTIFDSSPSGQLYSGGGSSLSYSSDIKKTLTADLYVENTSYSIVGTQRLFAIKGGNFDFDSSTSSAGIYGGSFGYVRLFEDNRDTIEISMNLAGQSNGFPNGFYLKLTGNSNMLNGINSVSDINFGAIQNNGNYLFQEYNARFNYEGYDATLSSTHGSSSNQPASILISAKSGTNAANSLVASNQNDWIIAYGGNDTVNGGDGSDTIDGGIGNDFIYAEAGDDLIISGKGNDYIVLGAGNDTIKLTSISDSSFTDGNDFVSDFTQGQDKIDISVLSLNDVSQFSVYRATNYTELSYGTAVIGFNGNYNFSNSDFIFTNTIYNTINGSGNADTISGTNVDDALFGNAGNDRLLGNAGNDSLVGGVGNDYIEGGFGQDTYRYVRGDGADTIRENGTNNQQDTMIIVGYNDADVSFSRSGATGLLINFINNPTDSIIVTDALEIGNDTLERINIIGGSIKTIEQLRTEVLARQTTTGNDTISGYLFQSNIINGDIGNDSITGGDSQTLYQAMQEMTPFGGEQV